MRLELERRFVAALALATGAILVACAAGDDSGIGAPIDDGSNDVTYSRHLGFGVPQDGFEADDRVIVHDQFALSYNRFRNGPNWVSWLLTKDDFGGAGRWDDMFYPDPKLPSTFYGVIHWDYGSSGWDRGHLVRSDERTRTVEDNKTTFMTTNILPQQHRLNVGPWLRFENYCKTVVTEGNEDLYLIAGGIFAKECATNTTPEGHSPSAECRTIGKTKDPTRRIAVPDKFWKIAVHLPPGRRLASVDKDTRISAIVIDNLDPNIYELNWVDTLTTVDEIEKLTGYDFLSKVAPEIQQVIEARVDRFEPPPK